MGDPESFTAQVKGVCPFCQKTFEAGKDAKGSPGVLHEFPLCKEFEDMDPDVYLKAVRLKYSS